MFDTVHIKNRVYVMVKFCDMHLYDCTSSLHTMTSSDHLGGHIDMEYKI